MFQIKVVEKIKIHILCSVTFFFRNSCHFCDNAEKYSTVGKVADDSKAQTHCMLAI